MAEGFCRRGGWARTNNTFLSPVHAGLQFLSRLEPWTFDTPTRTAMDGEGKRLENAGRAGRIEKEVPEEAG
jgi:hypothetical protein